MKTTTRGLLTFMAAWLAVPAFARNMDQKYSLEIARQPLAAALEEFSKQTGLQVGYVQETLPENSLTGPLNGRYTASIAITELLLPSGLSFERVNEHTIAVVGTKPQRWERGGSSTMNRSRNEPSVASFRPVANIYLAQARTAEEDAQQTRTAANARESDGDYRRRSRIEEVIVTATKRAENIQDIPISITAITADEINARGLVNAEDYLRGLPGVNLTESTFGGAIIIRGIETATSFQNFNSGATAATFFGETPTTSSAGLSGGANVDLKLVDIERVEVLRGPQGTAFGSSSMGGAVRSIPVAPKLDGFEGKAVVGYSVTSGMGGDNYNFEAIGNVPLIKDKLAIRAAGYRFEDSGIYRNVAGSDAVLRAATAPFGGEAFAVDQKEVGSYYVLGGRVSALFQPIDHLKLTLSYLSQKNETDGRAYAMKSRGTYAQSVLQVAPEHVVRGQKGGSTDMEIDIANAMMEFDLGWGDLLVTYSDVDSGTIQSYSLSEFGSPMPVSLKTTGIDGDNHREHVGEIRLATRLEGAWDFLAGIYAEEVKDRYHANILWHGDPARNVFPTVGPSLGNLFDRRDLKQKAVFGEASWEFLPHFTVLGGVRAYDYDRSFTYEEIALYGAPDREVREDSNDSGTNFRANLSYELESGALLYAGWTQGFRLGKVQPGLPSGACDLNGDGILDGSGITIESTREVDSDALDSYELGGKFALLDRRLTLDATVFRMDWSEIPVTLSAGAVGATSCRFLSYLDNAGDAKSQGIELQASYHVTNAFRIDLGGSWTDATLTDVSASAPPAVVASKGNRLPGSPKVNANLGLQYSFVVAGHDWRVRSDAIYVDSFFGNVQETPTTEAGNYVKLDVSTQMQLGNLSVDLFVRNLTNEDAFSMHANDYGYRLRPRTFGIRLGYEF